MSAVAENDNEQGATADLDVPMSDAASDLGGDYNAAPPPLPELFDDNNKPVQYVITLGLGKDGIKKETFDEKDEEGQKTGDKGVYFTADVLGRAIAVADGREMSFSAFDTFVRPPQRFTSFLRKNKPMAEIIHLAIVVGLDPQNYSTVGELCEDLSTELRKKGADAVQALATIQWQWYSKETKFTLANGKEKTGKIVRYNMKNADVQLGDGSYSAKIFHKETGEELRARAVITRLDPLV